MGNRAHIFRHSCLPWMCTLGPTLALCSVQILLLKVGEGRLKYTPTVIAQKCVDQKLNTRSQEFQFFKVQALRLLELLVASQHAESFWKFRNDTTLTKKQKCSTEVHSAKCENALFSSSCFDF